MRIPKNTALLTLSITSLTLLALACGNATNTTANNSPANSSTKSNTATVVNSNQTTANKTAPVSNASPTPAAQSEASEIRGELQVGKTESVILYVGAESGDYAAYCFTNDSEAGRAILTACKNKEQCGVAATIEDYRCKVPGLEADLSASGRIVKVESVKSLGRKK
ncbi:MAG TPA: hypothetical protein VGX92_18475 [Pyrinomonadaceae bacterium]|jgi:hypothetical protein|nr:hypothetical protein [Pyrinomonadaceae bacterium]